MCMREPNTGSVTLTKGLADMEPFSPATCKSVIRDQSIRDACSRVGAKRRCRRLLQEGAAGPHAAMLCLCSREDRKPETARLHGVKRMRMLAQLHRHGCLRRRDPSDRWEQSRPSLGPTQPHAQWGLRPVSPEVTLTTHFPLLPTARLRGALPPFLHTSPSLHSFWAGMRIELLQSL
jgi:hypothetical protein